MEDASITCTLYELLEYRVKDRGCQLEAKSLPVPAGSASLNFEPDNKWNDYKCIAATK